jgi:hypothetical protein
MVNDVGYGGRPAKQAWEGTLTFLPASLHVHVADGADGIVAEAHLMTFDRNDRTCKEAVEWTSNSIVFSDVQPECVSVFVVEYVLSDQSAPFIADMINGRQGGSELDLQMWAPEDGTMRVYEMGQTWRVFEERVPISASDLAILTTAASDVSGPKPLAVDRMALRDAPVFTELTCVPLWGSCGTVSTCCPDDARCERKNSHYAQCRDSTRPIPDDWESAIIV